MRVARPARPAAGPTVGAGLPVGERFHGLDGEPPRPARDSWRRRLAYRGLDLANRVAPKDASRLVLHSSVDVEDGVLALVAAASRRGLRSTVLLEDARNASRVHELSHGRTEAVPKRSLRGLLRFVGTRNVFTTSNVYGDRTPPATQVVVSLWHGEPPTKVTSRFEGHGGLHGTYAPVCSTVGRAYRSAEFDIPPLRVPIIGAPRNDRMLQADRAVLRGALLGPDVDRTVFL